MTKRKNAKALARGMRVLVAAPWERPTSTAVHVLLSLRLVYRKEHGQWLAVDKRGFVVADITLEDEGITWVRGWTKTTEQARALQATMALS